MADRPIDRQAWAELIAALIASETRGKKATFARLVGVDPKTIGHWLAGTVEVSEQSVRRVATAIGRPPMDLLVAVGYYRADEIAGPAQPNAEVDPDDEARRLIIDTDFPPRIKMRMLHRLEELRQRDRAREADEVRFWIEQAGETTDDLGRRT